MPVSPKVVKSDTKPETSGDCDMWTFSTEGGTVKNEANNTQWVTSSAPSKSNQNVTILKPQMKQSIIQMGEHHQSNSQFQSQPVTVAIITGQSALCLPNENNDRPVVVVASTPSERTPVQYVYMQSSFTVADANCRNVLPLHLGENRRFSTLFQVVFLCKNHTLEDALQILNVRLNFETTIRTKLSINFLITHFNICLVPKTSAQSVIVSKTANKINQMAQQMDQSQQAKTTREEELKNETNNTETGSPPDVAKKEFKLAPTPAQLGKAPLQRRQSMGNLIV